MSDPFLPPADPGDAASPAAQVAGTASFSKFMHVLQLVADWPEGRERPTVAGLVRASGYPRPTVHRIVAGLLAERLLVEGQGGSGLALGPRLIQLASRSWGRSELRLVAADELKRLRDLTGETVHLAVPNGNTMVYIEKLESPSAVRMASRIGTSVSMHSTAVGKAYLAALEPGVLDGVLKGLELRRHTPKTVADRASLRQQLDATRARGWSVDDEENESAIYCFGGVIRGHGGTPVAAISVSTLMFRQKDDPERAYVAPLLAACAAISARIAETPSLSAPDMV
ncbi:MULTISPECIES: IclR family transcriptional regulator [Ramlibacter]|jgi:DNA-binding IclR family transcriptional regulator|uniref:Helix-turn-helix domain-containing protein n=1 Tax=Ramlibacter pinisoli TaxID=2682844 RepID=A0A6N8J070_9BURK|nr:MULTISPECIES: IclR family transcriptional regulator [Ramlibacter]MBA2962270.1 IclR family transcriptional regulator [Ramlibacter sp. CGMCC 1.13660]MVQ32212.1 helix-turn-helix domain-containing protein [Ramlibacter pinisoli]